VGSAPGGLLPARMRRDLLFFLTGIDFPQRA
jgi:hypothetical protein